MSLKLDKVLVVEKEPQVSLFIREMFKNEWGQIDFASTCYEALEKIDRGGNNYDFIFLDLSLPDIQGVETVRTIRAASIAPVVAQTGDIELAEELEKNGVKLGVYGVIREGSLVKHRVADVIEKAILRWQMERVERVILDLREVKADYRRKLLERGH